MNDYRGINKGVYMQLKKCLVIVFVSLLAIGILNPIVHAQEVTGKSEAKIVHLNMKSGNKLSPMMPGEGVTQRVQAKYQDYGLVKVNREWVDIGTWSSESLFSEMGMSGEANFNLWVTDAEGSDNTAEFRFTIKKNEEEIGTVHIDSQSTSQETSEITASASITDSTFNPNDKVSIYLEYSGWNDIDIHFDNFTYDSGVSVSCNPLTIYGVSATKSEINLEFIDAFSIDWTEKSEITALTIGGQPLDVIPEVGQGEERQTNNGTVTTQLLIWKSDISFEKGLGIKISISYDGGNTTWDVSGEVGRTTIGNGGSVEGDDDDDDKQMFIIIGAVGACAAVVGIVVYFKKFR